MEPDINSRFRHYLPIPFDQARVAWLRFSILGEEWLPPPKKWDEVLSCDEKHVVRRVRRPDLGWTIDLSARLVESRAIWTEGTLRRGALELLRIQEAESLVPEGDATAVDGHLVVQPARGLGQLFRGSAGLGYWKDREEEWEHRRHGMTSSVAMATYSARPRSAPLASRPFRPTQSCQDGSGETSMTPDRFA